MDFVFLKRPSVRWAATTLLLDVFFFALTDPARVAPIWLMVGFLLAIITMYWVFRGATAALGVYSKAVKRNRKQLIRMLTVVSTIVIAMQSMGQLSLRDVLVLMPLSVLGYLYLRYNRRAPGAN